MCWCEPRIARDDCGIRGCKERDPRLGRPPPLKAAAPPSAPAAPWWSRMQDFRPVRLDKPA